jgi:DNA-nicking Smr family endonuclease
MYDYFFRANFTDALYKKYRAEVDAHAKARSKYYDEAKAAHDAGDGAKAKELSAKGKEEGRLMEEASLKAARAIFKGKNKDQPEDTIDLHGQHVNEAKLIVQEEIEAARKKKLAELKIIIGAGHHSDKDGPKVGPAVKKMLEEELNIKWRNDETNASGGCIIATL